MIRFLSDGSNPSDAISRREWLRIGGLAGLGSLGKRSEAAQDFPGFGKAKSVLLVYANGGQSQFETWDPKPDAPDGVRGEFRAISSATPGLFVCEHLPRLAALTDRFAIIHSVSHDDYDHGSATYLSLTGRPHPQKSSNPLPRPTDFPTLASVFRKKRPKADAPFPAVHVNGPALVPVFEGPGQDGGFLGREYEPILIRDPTAGRSSFPNFAPPDDVPSVRMSARRSLLDSVEDARRDWERVPGLLEMRGIYRQAYDLLDRPSCRAAFDLDAEPPAVRERYGRTRSGQACLLGRRLVEAGVPWITVFWNHSARGQDEHMGDEEWYGWDTHNDIFEVMRENLLPRFDRSFSALIEDLDARGLLDTTLVVCLGEFGRAPRVALEARFSGATPGRKHWANVYSIAAAGAGVAKGAVFGESDKNGAYPKADRVGPWDVAATMFAALGVDPASEYLDAVNRPSAVTIGKPIAGLY